MVITDSSRLEGRKAGMASKFLMADHSLRPRTQEDEQT